MRDLDKFRGCLIGGAAGDALGYEVEFMDETAIFDRFGPRGITEYVLHGGLARISDDTQMTLFTAAGLIQGATQRARSGYGWKYRDHVALNYRDWLYTQQNDGPSPEGPHHSWLVNVPGLYSRRAPGWTCLMGVEGGCRGRIETPLNNSKGCGGVMRVAPVGLYFAGKAEQPETVGRIGAEAAALTHGHELGYLPAAVLAHIVYLVVSDDSISLEDAVRDAMGTVARSFPHTEAMDELQALVHKAVTLSRSSVDDLAAIHQLGEGWTGEETLAIAIYCALKYSRDFDSAMIAAVNHCGDSDSTGAVAGNILGAYLGMSGIPGKYTEHLELRDVILEVADDLWRGCPEDDDPVWREKYVDMTYGVVDG